jgi:hypothetical protein
MPRIPKALYFSIARVLSVLLELIFNPNKTLEDSKPERDVGWRPRWTKSTKPEEPTNPPIQGVDREEGKANPQANQNTVEAAAWSLNARVTPRPTRHAKAAHFVILCVAICWLCFAILGINNLDTDTLTFAETLKQYLDELLRKGYSLLLYAYQFFLTAFSAI